MIDWQVQIEGRDPPGWDHRRDGCWFPDFDYQAYLLPSFDDGGATIDPYGGTEFKDVQLRRLRDRLLKLRITLQARPAFWTVSEASGEPRRIILLERKKLLAVVIKTLQMIDFALENGGSIVFRGD